MFKIFALMSISPSIAPHLILLDLIDKHHGSSELFKTSNVSLVIDRHSLCDHLKHISQRILSSPGLTSTLQNGQLSSSSFSDCCTDCDRTEAAGARVPAREAAREAADARVPTLDAPLPAALGCSTFVDRGTSIGAGSSATCG